MTHNTRVPTSIKITYFDFHGGRGEGARIALSIAGLPYEDDRISFAQWSELKPKTLFGGLPVLEVDGQRISQSNSINRYVGRLAGLYPDDAWEAARCDEVSDVVESLYAVMTPSFDMKDPAAQKTERERLVAGPIPFYLKGLAAILDERGGLWFSDGRLTMADLKVSEAVRHVTSGRLDHIPTDIVERISPTLVQHRQRVVEHPGVRAYYAKFGM